MNARIATYRWTLAGIGLLALYYLLDTALPYLRFEGRFMSLYQQRLGPLWLHVAFGSVALTIGPVQLWLGLNGRTAGWHRALGWVYVGAIFASVVAAVHLALSTPLGLVFLLGALGLALAWVLSTGMALLAIRCRDLRQHREWMMRSYVVTLAFVVFRASDGAMGYFEVGSPAERAGALIWLCWALPLLLFECALQGRRLRMRLREHVHRLENA